MSVVTIESVRSTLVCSLKLLLLLLLLGVYTCRTSVLFMNKILALGQKDRHLGTYRRDVVLYCTVEVKLASILRWFQFRNKITSCACQAISYLNFGVAIICR